MACAAFHREKFLPFGPPSGGNGGRGGDVYILPTPELTTLTSVTKRDVAKRRAKDEWEAEAEALEGLEPADKQARMRDIRWVHYPRYSESNVERDAFKEAEQLLYKEMEEPIYLDLDKELEMEKDPNLPLGLPRKDTLGHLVASGSQGGLGNPHFLSPDNRSPKFATRGHEGERITLSLELKLSADIGLVGMPGNAGKSTLLRALTGGRAKTEVASYAFTTLSPIVGVVRVTADDRSRVALRRSGSRRR
ncbi:GTP1/OBG domain-containing protein [Lentinula raphanica]|nr:GTP1/OBG domain-containing protein [Lentinula raphanica]